MYLCWISGAYEEKINRLGIDIMLLGVSSDGSIGTPSLLYFIYLLYLFIELNSPEVLMVDPTEE